MNRFSPFVFVAVFGAVFCAPAGFAQNPANVISISGNGQLICGGCPNNAFQFFEPLVVKVTDANNNPVPSATVNWSATSVAGGFQGVLNPQTITDANGMSSNFYSQTAFGGSALLPYLQTAITATSGTGTTTFIETQALLINPSGSGQIGAGTVGIQVFQRTDLGTPFTGTTINGVAGTPAGVPEIYGAFTILGAGVPGISVRLANNQTNPSASCQTGPGADVGSVLTDATGLATCTPVFGGGAGTGSFFAIVGGVLNSVNNGSGPAGYFITGNVNMIVTPGVPTTAKAISGNSQIANAGQNYPLPLVAQIGDASGNPLSAQPVTWSVSPAGAAILSNTTTVTDANGQVHTTVTSTNAAGGQFQVIATVTGKPAVAAIFTELVNLQVTSLVKVSGDPQIVIVNTPFPQPLVVALGASNGLPGAGFAVQFSATGAPVTLSSSTINTDANGRAQVTVTAGASAGTVTVTANAGSFSVTFALTIIPPGPSITANTFFNAADMQRGSISPCSLATIIASGIAPTLQGGLAAQTIGPLPLALGGDSLTFNGVTAPILSLSNSGGQQQITFQVPCEVTAAASVPVTVNVSGGSSTTSVPVLPASPGIYQTVMSDSVTRGVFIRPDGSFVSLANPARRGETVISLVTGLGPTSPSVGTNSLPVPGSSANVLGQVIVGVNNGGIPLTYAKLSADLPGVYLVAFQIPSNSATGNNVVFSIGLVPSNSSTVFYSAGSLIPIQ